MTSNSEQQAREIFDQLVVLPAAQWPAELERLCEDQSVRSRVRQLLDHHVLAKEFLARPAAETFPGMAGAVGETLAEFRIVRELGRGAMGVVYLAEDTTLNRVVALKVMAAHLLGAEPAAARFVKEAQAIARLSHPGIVQVYRYGESRGFAFIAMEFVSGDTLKHRLTETARTRSLHAPRHGRPVPSASSSGAQTSEPLETPRGCARLIADVAEALDHAHQNGVIHRDIKPSNILIDRAGRARLTDFGVAKVTTDQTLSATGDLAGSYPYMSPEQARVRSIEVDHRSDIFSLGIVLYESLTLRRPFDGPTPSEILRALSEGQPKPVRKGHPHIPRDLAVICHKALEHDPQNRYQTAAHMAGDLRCFLGGQPILARPPTITRRARQWAVGHRRSLVAALLVLLVALSGALAWRQHRLFVAAQSKLSLRLVNATDKGTVTLAREDPATHNFIQRETLGDLPVNEAVLSPGTCRFVVIDGQGRRAEGDLYLSAGTKHSRTVVLRDPEQSPAGMMRFGGASMAVSYYEPANGSSHTTPLTLDAYWLDAKPVTNSQYRSFVDAVGRTPPPFWREVKDFSSIADRPVVDISRREMEEYAGWMGKRLPTAYEWLAAAQFPDGRRTPWGSSSPPADAAPSVQIQLTDQDDDPARLVAHYLAGARAVGSPPLTSSASGLSDQWGNVFEMTGTTISNERGVCAVVAGGYWARPLSTCDLGRFMLYPISAQSTQIGFRCAKSVLAPVNPTQ